ncbi:MAG: hypothetical protein CVV24_04170 [Ignavibacteriae bacterium HGW-Ignavibacteriae-3]|nr:MAG: hypothetical protein CVV24_04170 [Ignavibacteriae bacterium HGW-Ignavibacteriae-3]
MRFKMIIISILMTSIAIFASDHGIYLLTVANIKGDINKVGEELNAKLKSAGFDVLDYKDIATPDLMRQKKEEHCGFSAKLILLSSNDYTKMLTSYGNKYLVASFLRVGLYESENGIQIVIADLETINRIVFNDLWENGKESDYNQVISKTKIFKSNLVKTIHSIGSGIKVEKPMEPIRSDEDLRESSRDMFMMVGKMTFFNDEDQFPVIYKRKNTEGRRGLEKLINEMQTNLKNFKPLKDDLEYRYVASPDVMKWSIMGRIYSPDSSSILLGITRPQTEGLSFLIAGGSRENKENKCPGIDHVVAYPIEVLLTQKDGQILVSTPREMFRMDMYFWDAGKMAFMNHMSMPSVLDESIGVALLGKEYKK